MGPTDFLYRLLYHREFRKGFFEGRHADPDFEGVDHAQLEAASQKIILRTQALLRDAYPGAWAQWGALFPQDAEGFELSTMFLESGHFQGAHDLAQEASSGTVPAAFKAFLREKLPDNEKYRTLKDALGR
jgi:hypothetical protein